ncbi:MAG: hypothetical protein ABH986_00450 [archaeon]
MSQDETLSRIKQTEESARKRLSEAEKKKAEITEDAKAKSISLTAEADRQDNDFREKELQKARQNIKQLKEKLARENNLLIESIRKKSSAKIKSEPKFILKKFSEEIL